MLITIKTYTALRHPHALIDLNSHTTTATTTNKNNNGDADHNKALYSKHLITPPPKKKKTPKKTSLSLSLLLTDYVNCTAGVKQGDVCSPVLFSLFINELALQVIDKGRHGACFMVDTFELFILLLADDVILMSKSVVGLQTQLKVYSMLLLSLN